MATRNSRHHIQEDSSMPLSLRERQAVVRELAIKPRNGSGHASEKRCMNVPARTNS